MVEQRFRYGAATAIPTLFLLCLISLTPASVALVHPSQRSIKRNHRQHSSFVNNSAPRRTWAQTRTSFLAPSAQHNAAHNILHNSAGNNVDAPSKPQLASTEESTKKKKHKHTLAILTMPHSASARIANEAILETAISITNGRLSIVLRTNTGGTNSATGEGHSNVSLTQLRRYAGEIYSMAWDAALGLDERERSEEQSTEGAGPISRGFKLLDLIVYPQNMPNTPPEGWIDLRPDLSCICSHDSITGWITSSSYAGGSGQRYATKEGQGVGGLRDHVDAVNAERASKGLPPAVALHVDDWPDGAEVTGDPNVIFLEDEDAYNDKTIANKKEDEMTGDDPNGGILGGTSIPPSSLYSSVCVGGTFDGMHYGHRKLLTLAVSSVRPVDGRLLIGVTRDEMLTHKAFSESIPPLNERIAGVLDFVGNLAPGMMNRVRCVPITDEYGPPGQPVESDMYPGLKNDFDALVLSHETLPTGRKLNVYREEVLGLEKLKLLCTQRTEPHGMSSTALRRMRASGK